MHVSTLIKPISGSDLDYYPGQLVIRLSDADPVHTIHVLSIYKVMCVVKVKAKTVWPMVTYTIAGELSPLVAI